MAQLWADLKRVVEAGGTRSDLLGSAVLTPSPSNTPAGVQSWIVAAGQQRLTTFGILLCAIRNHVRDTDRQLAAKIDDLYVFNKYASGPERYRRPPTKADRRPGSR